MEHTEIMYNVGSCCKSQPSRIQVPVYPAAEEQGFLAAIPISYVGLCLTCQVSSAHLSGCFTSKKSGQIEQLCKSPAAWPWALAINPSFPPFHAHSTPGKP